MTVALSATIGVQDTTTRVAAAIAFVALLRPIVIDLAEKKRISHFDLLVRASQILNVVRHSRNNSGRVGLKPLSAARGSESRRVMSEVEDIQAEGTQGVVGLESRHHPSVTFYGKPAEAVRPSSCLA